MEKLRRRAEQLAREVDIRRQAAGEPSVLDLRPRVGPFVDMLLRDCHRLMTIEGFQDRAEIPWERLVVYSREKGLPLDHVADFMLSLLHQRNQWREELRENQ